MAGLAPSAPVDGQLALWPGRAPANLAYSRGWKRSYRVAAPVVSVGNLTMGGTGKTPCVEYVAGFYRKHERRVAILSRGYGSQCGGLNDEGLVLSENVPDAPPYQGADRVALARAAIEESESEVLILDDGFQHRRLARDLDLVLIDATRPWGYGFLPPRGLLREPPSSLRRADGVVLTRCDQAAPDALSALIGAHRPAGPAPLCERGGTQPSGAGQRRRPRGTGRAAPASCGGILRPGQSRGVFPDPVRPGGSAPGASARSPITTPTRARMWTGCGSGPCPAGGRLDGDDAERPGEIAASQPGRPAFVGACASA